LNKYDDNEEEIEEEVSRFIPKPIDLQTSKPSEGEKLKLQDWKKGKSASGSTNNMINVQKQHYLPDNLASKLVDDILNSKFN
jgi:hypothetical protein